MTINITKEKDKIIEQKCGLKEFHEATFEVLKIINDICEKNNIKYSTMYGSMIGHIRHHGFIPWDDDADVIFTREEYNRFLNAWNSIEHVDFKLITPMSYDGVFLDMTDKIVNLKAKFQSHGGYANYPLLSYARVDLFVLDYVPTNKIRFLLHTFRLKIIYALASYRIGYKIELKRPLLETIGLNFFKFFGRFFSLKKSTNMFLKASQTYNPKKNSHKYYHVASSMVTIDHRYKSEWIENVKKIPFESIDIPCFSNTDVLSETHRNFMEPKIDTGEWKKHIEFSALNSEDIIDIYSK